MKKIILFSVLISLSFASCKKKASENKDSQTEKQTETAMAEPFFKLSLAQWSLNKAIRFEGMNPIDFAEKANELGFEGIEYVSQLYNAQLESMGMESLLDTLKGKSEKYGLKNVLIMVDGEGDLAAVSEEERNTAIENHKKWVDAAQFLGCRSIRVNLFGSREADVWKETATIGLGKLADYGATKNVNIIVENHGYLSSNAALLVEVMKAVGKPNCGTLPDFGNFCLKRESGEQWGVKCIEEYDKYKGVEEMMPFAKAVSAKSYDFDDTTGEETLIDYQKMLKIVKDAGYTGFIGVEYEGERLGEVDGINATKKLLIEASKKL